MGNYYNSTHYYKVICGTCNGIGCDACGNTGYVWLVGQVSYDSTSLSASTIDEVQALTAQYLVNYQPVGIPGSIGVRRGPFGDLKEVCE